MYQNRCKIFFFVAFIFLVNSQLHAQSGLVHTNESPFAKMHSVGLKDVQWTNGFWKERFDVCRNVMLPELWNTYTNKNMCYAFQNFRIAAGLDTGRFRGPSFHDGDFYKTLEAAAAMYAATKDPAIDRMMDEAITVIAKAQRNDGYVYTKNIIDQKKSGKTEAFDDKLSFEAYNFGHLMTAACVHFRATGKTTLLQVAIKAADFLIGFYAKATPELARNAICPSHYMGLTELYRTTHDKKYLDLVVHLIDIRGQAEGTDDNSDRLPFDQMKRVVGHAVRANYLFAGAADVYAENGDQKLLNALDSLWENVTKTKLYVTGGCGALYDGVSLDGTSYKPDSVFKVHQAYGRDYQLPNLSAHNETCANIGNVLWNWRMFLLTGDSKYMDILELSLYNSVLSGVGINGHDYFYTNPLAASTSFPYHLRWEGGRIPYISKSNCCPPNTVRTIAEVQQYQYTISNNHLYVNLFSGNTLSSQFENGQLIQINQITSYPWSGKVEFVIDAFPKDGVLSLRIPEWSQKFQLKVNGLLHSIQVNEHGYVDIRQNWKRGDKVELFLDFTTKMMVSNPLIEETRNQVTVKRGPLVYCLESADTKGANLFSMSLSPTAMFKPINMKIGNGNVVGLQTNVVVSESRNWKKSLYQEYIPSTIKEPVVLIPYFAWANRGKSDMTVWIPLAQ